MLAKNEAAAPGTTYIVHTQEPSFIGEVKRFTSGIERENYVSENTEKEFIEINSFLFVEIKKYLTSDQLDSRREYLRKAVKHWLIANGIK